MFVLLALNSLAAFWNPVYGFELTPSGFAYFCGLGLVQIAVYFLATAAWWPRIHKAFRVTYGIVALICIGALVSLEATNTQVIVEQRLGTAQDNTKLRADTIADVEAAEAETARLQAAGAYATQGELTKKISEALARIPDGWRSRTNDCREATSKQGKAECEVVLVLYGLEQITQDLAHQKQQLTQAKERLSKIRETGKGNSSGIAIPPWFSWLIAGLAHILMASAPALERLALEERERRERPPEIASAVSQHLQPIRGLHSRARALVDRLQAEGGRWTIPDRAALAAVLGCDQSRVRDVIAPLVSSGLIVVHQTTRFWAGAIIELREEAIGEDRVKNSSLA